MAEPQQKRLREETHDEFDDSNSNPKRQKPYKNILSILDDDEEEDEQQPAQDLSDIFTTLQQEISPSAALDFDSPPFTVAEEEAHLPETTASCGDGEDEGVKSVMRHLLEASDDELGIPNTEENNVVITSGDNFAIDDGLWELEDVPANYFTMLQSEFIL